MKFCQLKHLYNFEIEGHVITYSEKEPIKQALLKAINELPRHQQTVIRLFDTESYPLKQISDMLGISIGTAKSRLFHAREKLKKNYTIKKK